jgi:hypothetical protein
MGVYFITIFLLFLFSLHEIISADYKKKRLFLFFSYIILVCVVGLRWETGTDWEPYKYLFSIIYSWQNYLDLMSQMEVGYAFLNFVIRTLTDNYSVFLVFHAAIMYFFMIYSLNKLTNYPQITLLLIFCSMLGMMGSNRQLLALSICLFALTLLLNNKKIPFLGIVASSMLFHTTSLLFSIYYFFNRKIKSLFLYSIIIVAFIIGRTQLPIRIFSFFGRISELASVRTDIYLESAKDVMQSTELSILGLLYRIIFVFLFISLRDKVSSKMPNYNVFLNGYIMGVVFYFLFSNTILVMVSRGSLFFSIMEPLLLSSVIYIFRSKIHKLVYIVGLLAIGILQMYRSIALYPDLFDPYKGIFINTFFNRIMY